MRTLKTSLALLSVLVPTTAFAQDPVALEEEPAAAAPAAPAADASASGSVSLDAGATGAATTAAPAPAAAAEPAKPAARPPAARQGAGTYGGAEPDGQTWAFTYSGYLRAPMRQGFGSHPHFGNMSIHAPVLPDDQYASWQFSPHNKREWAEMFFTMGNGIVSGTVAVQGFQFTDATWSNPTAQFGIGQGWVEVNSDLGFENIKFNAKVGSHWARYGRAGVYDAGEYDTYLIGRTHTLGGTGRVDFDLDGTNLGIEFGYGVNRPNPEMFNRARFTNLGHVHAFLKLDDMEFGLHAMHSWTAQGVTPLYPNVLPGSNCGPVTDNNGNIGGAQCIPITPTVQPGVADIDQPNSVWSAAYPNGSQTILGADARLDLGVGGYLYAGVSHQMLSNALTVGGAVESIHTLGGGNYNLGIVDNYLESSFCPTTGQVASSVPQGVTDPLTIVPNGSCSNGDGRVTTILAQYELSLSNFDVFEGDQDLKFKLYGMANFVGVSDREVRFLQPIATAQGRDVNDLRQNGVMKLKFGVDAEYFFLPWMSAGLRFDRLQPNSKIDQQTFMILTPRISFRTQMVTHETISLSYSRYFYNQRVCAGASPADDPFRPGSTWGADAYLQTGLQRGAYESALCTQSPASPNPPDGFGSTASNQPVGMRGAPTLIPDENVIKLEASMWW